MKKNNNNKKKWKRGLKRNSQPGLENFPRDSSADVTIASRAVSSSAQAHGTWQSSSEQSSGKNLRARDAAALPLMQQTMFCVDGPTPGIIQKHPLLLFVIICCDDLSKYKASFILVGEGGGSAGLSGLLFQRRITRDVFACKNGNSDFIYKLSNKSKTT